jgi:hypothetical protein
MNGTDFATTYAVQPTYELWDTDGAIPDMREAVPGSINNQGGLTNGDEVIILYYWDGMSDLVSDVDYIIYDDSGNVPNEAVDKTGVSIDGPDPDTDPSTYLDDTPIPSQLPTAAPTAGFSNQRIDLNEGAQVTAGGNGVTGADETSEDLDNTFLSGELPTPNAPHPSATAIGNDQNIIPAKYILHQNFPNPFNPATVISWQLAVSSPVNLSVFDLTGQQVAVLIHETQPAGNYQIEFDADHLASGIYLYRLEATDFVQIRKMIFLK